MPFARQDDVRPQPQYYSQYLADPDDPANQQVDRETIENLAALVGVSVKEIEDKIKEQERLHELAWKKRRRRKDERAGGVTGFIEVVAFRGKQLFWSLSGQSFVVSVEGRTYTEPTMKGALHRLACG